MTLVEAKPQQCDLATLPPSSPANPGPCASCVKLHQDIKQSVQMMMDKFDILYMRMESLIREKESENRSESGSEKDVPSPSDSRSSPSLAQGARKRKPCKESLHKMESEVPAKKEELPAVATATATTPASTATANISPPDFGLASMDAVNQQQQLLQFIMQQGMQQATKQDSPDPASTTQTIMEQIQQQFKEIEEMSGDKGDNGSAGDGQPVKELEFTPEEVSISAELRAVRLCKILNQLLLNIEDLLKKNVPFKTLDPVKHPYTDVVEKVKVEIAILEKFATVDNAIFHILDKYQLLNASALEIELKYMKTCHVIFENIRKVTQTTSPAQANQIVTEVFGAIEVFCQRIGTPLDKWHDKIWDIINENDRLHSQVTELKARLQIATLLDTPGTMISESDGMAETNFQENIPCPFGIPKREQRPQNPLNQSEQFYNSGTQNNSSVVPSHFELYFKTQSLPPVAPFKGNDSRTLDEFLIDFDAKYPPIAFSEIERRSVFVKLLQGNAYKLFKSLDLETQKGNLCNIIDHLRRLLRKDAQIGSLQAKRELSTLVLSSDNLTQFCENLEHLTKKIYPTIPAEELSFMQASELYERIVDWPNSIDALRILEQTPRSSVYSELKKFVCRVDRVRQHHQNLKSVGRNPQQKNRQNVPSQRGAFHGQAGQQRTNTSQPVTCHGCGEVGHYRPQCPHNQNNSSRGNNPSFSSNNGSSTPEIHPNTSTNFSNQRYSSGDQRNPPRQQNYQNNAPSYNNPRNNGNNNGNYNRNGQQNGRQSSIQNIEQVDRRPSRIQKPSESSSRDKLFSIAGVASHICSLVVNDLAYFGAKSLYEVSIGTVKGIALVDSGAQPSVLPLSTYKYIINTLPEPENFLKLLDPLPGTPTEIYNASGVAIPVRAQVLVNIKLLVTDIESQVVFHVVEDPPGQQSKDMLIGTNAFADLGIKLTFSSPNKAVRTLAEKVDVKSHEISPVDYRVEVAKRIELLPNETRWISVKMAHFMGNQQKTALVSSNKDAFGRETFTSAVCQFDQNGNSRILVNNTSPQTMVFVKGQNIGNAADTEGVYQISSMQVQEIGEILSAVDKERCHDDDRTRKLVDIASENRKEPLPYEIIDILDKFKDYFAIDDDELRQTNLVVHDIDTGSATPIRQKLRPVPVGVRKPFREIIKSLLDRQVIEPSSSPWASPIVLVVKKDGSLRLCIDFRELNKVITLDAYPLPPIDGILQSLEGKKYFSTLDLASGFWQIALNESAKPKTAFLTSEGLFQFRVLPFGLATSPASFQRLMNTVLAKFMNDKREVHIYIDDILISTDTIERHFIVLHEVMEELRKANLAVKIQKCTFLEKSVQYLGHVIDGEGIRTDPKKVEVIKNATPPKSAKELRSFLGLAGYYRKFVLRFASIANPLFKLTQNTKKFEWNLECDKAFNKLKDALCTAPVLAQPDIEGAMDGSNGFIIYTDASNKGVGSVLCQRGKDSCLHPVWFTSKGLTASEANYHVTDLEALAVVVALRKFQSLIYNMKSTVVRTDHLPLLCLFKKQISARMIRWAMLIQHFNVKLEYVKGQANVVADALSRGLSPAPDDTIDICEDLSSKTIESVQVEDNWLTELEKDITYSHLIEFLSKTSSDAVGQNESRQLKEIVQPPSLSLYDGHRKLRVQDFAIDQGNLWLILDDSCPRRTVPASKRRSLFDIAHQGVFAGHFSPRKISSILRRSYYWEHMCKDVIIWHKNCEKCFLSNAQDILVPPLKPIVTSRPFELVGVDLMELGLTTKGNRYVLVLIDHFTKWVGAYPIPNKTAEIVGRVIATRWIAEGRWPECFLSDQGPEFINETLDVLRGITKIKWTFSKGYSPRENGITERFNRTLQRSLKKSLVNPADWDDILPFVVYAYNTTAHASTGDSPYFLLHGTDPILPISTDMPARPRYQEVDYDQYKECLFDSLKEAREIAVNRIAKEMERCKSYYDKRFKTETKRFPKTGDRVFLRLPPSTNRHPKLTFDIKGPYRVLEVSDNSALITLIYSNEEPLRVQFDLLIIVPPSLETTEWNKNRRRKILPRHLKSLGQITPHIELAFINVSVFRETEKIVEDTLDELHPNYRCVGSDNGNGAVAYCPIETSTVADLLNFYNYHMVPDNIASQGLATVTQVASILAVIEDRSIHQTTKHHLLIHGMTVDINDDCWTRAYSFVAAQCRHLRIALDIHAGITVTMKQPIPKMEHSAYNAILQKTMDPPKHSFTGTDIFVFPMSSTLQLVNKIQFRHCDISSYKKEIKEATALLFTSDYRNMILMLPHGIKEEALSTQLQELQKAAALKKTLILLVLPLTVFDMEGWKRAFGQTINGYSTFTRWCDTNKHIRHVHLHLPGKSVEENSQIGRSHNLLGLQLKKLFQDGLSLDQLELYFQTLHAELKEEGSFTGIITMPTATRRQLIQEEQEQFNRHQQPALFGYQNHQYSRRRHHDPEPPRKQPRYSRHNAHVGSRYGRRGM